MDPYKEIVQRLAKVPTKEEFEENPMFAPQEDDFNENLDELVKASRELIAKEKDNGSA